MNEALQILAANLPQVVLACLVALGVSVLAGLSGFGTGLVLPLFLVPVVGVANVIPVMAVAMLFNNGSRVVAFWGQIRWGMFVACCCSGCQHAWSAPTAIRC